MRDAKARMLHHSLLRIALSFGHVFAWVFVFKFFYLKQGTLMLGLSSALLTYALAQVLTLLFTPLFAKFLRYGFKRMLVYSTLLLAFAFGTLSVSLTGNAGSVGWGIVVFAVGVGLYRALYFVPYAFAREHEHGKAGILWEIAVALAPLFAGLSFGLGPVAIALIPAIVAVVLLLAITPLFTIEDAREGYQWGYRRTFHELFALSRLRMLLATVMGGVEGAALLLLWPLLVFMLLNWSFPMLGVVLSSTFLLALILRTFLENSIAKMSPITSALVNASAWLMRLSVGGAVGVVLVDTYFYVGSRPRRRALDMQTFEQAADNSTYVDEHTALKEMGFALGRLLLCLGTVGLLTVFSVPMTFLVAFSLVALAAALSVYLAA